MIGSFYTQSKDPKAKTGNDKQSVFMGAQSVFMASLDMLFSSNHNIHKSSYGFCICYKILIKGSEAQIQKPYELLLML